MDARALLARLTPALALYSVWQSLLPLYRAAALLLLAAWLGSVLPEKLLLPLLLLAAPALCFAASRPAAILLLLVALNLWRFSVPDLPDQTCTFIADVSDFPAALPPRAQRIPATIVKSDDCPALTGTHITLFDYDNRALLPGSLWRIRATLRANDYGINATVRHAAALPDSGFSLRQWRSTLDQRIRAHFDQAHARWFQALLIGKRQALRAEDRALLRESGTAHLLAISGLHVGLVALMAYWTGKSLVSLSRRASLILAPRNAGLAVMLLAALLYVILSGAQAPAIRAWIMLLGLTLHWFIPRLQSGSEGLALAASVSLLFDPAIIHAPGAWLSYLATFIVILAWQRYRSLPALLQWLLIQSWITLALTPLIWAWFGGISLIAWLANLIVIPWLGALLLLGALATLSPFFQPAAQILLDHILATLHALNQLPAAYLEPGWQPATAAAIAAYGLIAARLARGAYQRPLLILLLITSLWPLRPQAPALYQTPNDNAAILHDREGSIVINPGYRYRERDDARRYLLPELRRRARAPVAILITADKKRHHSALKTLLDAYPQTPVITLVPLKDYPFAVAHCPDALPLPAPWQFSNCALLTPDYRIDRHGIQAQPR